MFLMNHKHPEDITFQITVGELALSSCLVVQDIHVTICIEGVSKITCAGELSEDGLTVTWNHPFLFSASPSTAVEIAIYTLPEELTPEWDKQLLGSQMVSFVACLLESGNTWQCNVPGFSTGFATLSIMCMTNDVLIIPDNHDCLSALTEYETRLYELGKNFIHLPCVSTQVELGLARLDLCPLGHKDHTTILGDLGTSFLFCYDQGGDAADLNRAIELGQRRLDLCPLDHPEHVQALEGLIIALERQQDLQDDQEGLNRLIEMQQEWLHLCPSGHPEHIKALGSFANSLWGRYLMWKDIADLEKAIEMEEKVLELHPTDHPDHDVALNNLAQSLISYYKKMGNLTDLNRAIDLMENFLELCPPGHQHHGLALRNLASSLQDRYNKLENHSDLIRAVKLYKEALETYQVHDKTFATCIFQLGPAILLLSNCNSHPPDQPLPSIDEAFDVYRLLKRCGPAASLSLWIATQTWVKDAERYNHPSVLEAYQTSLNALDHFTSLSSSLDSRHGVMQARVADLANDAFSSAIRHGSKLRMAAELLERGRGILWNQLARFDISIAVLESQGNQERELGRKFMQLSTKLRKHAEQSVEEGTDPYWRVQEGWQRVVDKIRGLDGFSRFLLPPRFDDLQQAAEYGPVIIVNASSYGCDALIALHTRAPIHVPLHCSLDDVLQLCSQLSELTQDSHAYGRHRESYVKELMRELWTSVVERIVSVLQNDVQLLSGSRIWWCPTSKFTMLPLHAAGPYRKAKRNLMDIYISSYAPSLSALLRARDRVRAQRVVCNASGTPNMISFAAVGQANPSRDTNLGQLPEVEHEIQRIRNETDMPAHVAFNAITGAAASIEGAVQAFRDHRWVHVACHGAQHAQKPFESWFAMGDGKLTLMRIIQERYTGSEFAFLSACHTAKGDASTPDEVLHLAAGIQFAGFNGVIGTLWRVDDAVAHQVVTRFYKEMFKQPNPDFERAAAALNTAVIETADEVSLEKRIVFVHIGI